MQERDTAGIYLSAESETPPGGCIPGSSAGALGQIQTEMGRSAAGLGEYISGGNPAAVECTVCSVEWLSKSGFGEEEMSGSTAGDVGRAWSENGLSGSAFGF